MANRTSNTSQARGAQTALVLGAAGGVGGETVAALVRHGWHVKGLARNPAQAAAGPNASTTVEWITGDALNRPAVVDAARGAQVIVHAVNPAGYRNWAGTVLPMIDNTVAAARAADALILLPGTIYNYGLDAFPILTEASPQHPTTRKGAIRVKLEQRLLAASREGVRTLVLRAGDFFGPRPGNSWFSQALVKPGKPVHFVTNPGPPGVGHSWAYLPDVAEAFVQLAERAAELEPFATFHFEGHWDPDGTAMTAAIRRVLGRPGIGTRKLSWGLLRLIAPFNETVRELLEMKPLWGAPVRLDNTRLLAILGREPRTPLNEAVAATLRGIGAS